jgi:hypothetical protein
MTPEQFAYWLQGYTELTAGQQPTPEQWKSITEHLKITPPVQQTWPLAQEPFDGRARPARHKTLEDYIRDSQQVSPFLPPGIQITC